MDAILNLGIAVILFLQSLGAWLVGLMKIFTSLGNEEFYLIVAPAVYWCVDAGLGLRVGLMLMISTALNSVLKMLLHGPRPHWIDPRVQAHVAEISFGVPSNHSQSAVVVWGTLAARIKQRWAWYVAIALMFLIGLSRLVMGVHFLHDVLVGWFVGVLLLWAYLAWEPRFTRWIKGEKGSVQVLLALGVSLAFILVGYMVRLASSSWILPTVWIENAALAYPDHPIVPLALSGLVSNAGTFFGLALGGVLLQRRGWFDAGGPAWQRIVRFVIGLIGVLILWYGLGLVFPRGESLLPYLLRYLRYGLVGMWITGLAPMIFIWLKLAKPSH